jgi:hypothetical protein
VEQHQANPETQRRVVLAYRGLPVVTGVALIGIFLAVFFFSGSVLLSSLVAAVPSVFLIWRWILAGRQIDRWGCPKCVDSLPKKMYWSYPPKVCPRCGERLDW